MPKRILIVDDEQDLVDLLSLRLESAGYTVDVAYDGEEGLKMALASKPDLILLDVLMPKLDGYQVCRELRKNPATMKVPVIFLSAHAREADRHKGLEAGGNDYIAKPFEPSELIQTIRRHLQP